MADTWKTVDGETLEYLTTVARLILERYKQIVTDLGGPLEKEKSKTNKKATLIKQPPKVSASTSAGVYDSLCSVSNATNQDFPFAIDGGTNETRQNGSANHLPITTSFGTSDSSIDSVFNGQGPPEFELGSDGKHRKSLVSLDSTEHSIVTSEHPSFPDILGLIEARTPSGLVHQKIREDRSSFDLLMERLVQGDMSGAVDMSDDDITQMLSSSD